MKKYCSILLLAMLVIPGCNRSNNKKTVSEAKIFDADAKVTGTVNIYKFKETDDVPYLDVEEAMKAFGYTSSSVSFPDKNHVSLNNDLNNAHASFDLVNNKVNIDDTIGFSSRFETTYDAPQVLEEERMWNVKLNEELSKGLQEKAPLTVDYGLYGFKTYLEKENFYIPFSLFNLITKSFEISDYYSNYAFNGQDVFPIESNLNPNSKLGAKYYGSGYANTEMTAAMADYNYQTTCMIFDYLYMFDKSGIGKITRQEGISFFDQYFETHNMKDDLSGTNQDNFDKTFANFISRTLDDPHTSSMSQRSVYFGKSVSSHTHRGTSGPRNSAYWNSYMNYYMAKSDSKSAISNNYKINGDMGLISFDNFVNISPADFNPYEESWNSSYYSYDTSLLFRDAFDAFEKNGNVKNIVIDVSSNTGGSTGTFAQLTQYMIQNPHITTKNLISGGIEDKVLNADTNFDGKFDEDDCYEGKYNFFILAGPVSFSCGNFFPAFCKQSKCATVIGQKSGGGSCVVYQIALPNGTIFQMSGMQEICYDPNGGTDYISDDAGVEPDYLYGSDDISDFYNLTKLRSFVAGLPNND